MATILKPTNPQTQPISTMDEQRKRQQRGTGFTNISSVLKANQGAGQQMGQKIGQNISGQAESVRQGIQQGQSQFQAGKQQAAQQAQGNIQAVGQYAQKQPNETDEQYQQRVAQAGGDLSKLGQTMRDTTYTGPAGIQNAEQLQTRAASVGQLGQLAGTRGGQTELLRNIVANRGGYTRGQSALDQLLLGQSREGQMGLQQARSAASGLGQETGSQIQSAAQQAVGAKSAIEQQKQDVAKALQEQGQGIQSLGKQQAEAFQTEAERLRDLITGRSSKTGELIKGISPEDEQLLARAQEFGLTDANLYAGSEDATSAALGGLASSLTRDFGGKKFVGSQQAAATNLAKLMGDEQTAKQLAEGKFNTDVFSKDERLLQPAQIARQQREAQLKEEFEAPARSVQQGGSIYDAVEQMSPGIRSRIDNYYDKTYGKGTLAKGIKLKAFYDAYNNLSQRRLAESAAKDWSKDERLVSQDKKLFDVIKSRLKKQGAK